MIRSTMAANNKMKKVKLISADSQESIEMEELSDDDDDVFVRNNRNGEAGDAARRPLMKKKKVEQLSLAPAHVAKLVD